MKKFGLLSALAMMLTLPACVTAKSPDSIARVTTHSTTIDVSDIDHTTNEGVEVLRKRVSVAAVAVCAAMWRTDRFLAYYKKTCRDAIKRDFEIQRRNKNLKNDAKSIRAVKLMKMHQ